MSKWKKNNSHTIRLYYFPLLEELIHSIRKFKESENINICVLDAGLSSTQVDKISTLVDEIKKAEWDIEISFHKKNKEWLKAKYQSFPSKIFS